MMAKLYYKSFRKTEKRMILYEIFFVGLTEMLGLPHKAQIRILMLTTPGYKTLVIKCNYYAILRAFFSLACSKRWVMR